MSLLDDFLEGLRIGIEAAHHVNKSIQFTEFVKLDRQTSMEFLSQYVRNYSAAQLDDFEREFLGYAAVQIQPAVRIRAMELYAFLKILEFHHYGKFRGFVTQSYALE